MHAYQAFQLNILSDLELPELLPCPDQSSFIPDVNIQFGSVCAEGLDQPLIKAVSFQASEQALWLHVPHVARYLITEGCQIIIDPLTPNENESIRLFLLGSCMGALLMQRNLFLLHANAIKIGNHCISFSGPSGIGKSTLSGAFLQQGYSILADDVCAINQQGEVIPSFPQIRLWADASKKLTIETEFLKRIRPNIEKFSVPIQHQFHPDALPLKVVYLLNSHNKETFELTDLTGKDKFNPIKNNTYRVRYLRGLGKDRSHLKHCGAIASMVSVVRIMRPNHGFQLHALVDLIKADLTKRGLSYA